MTYQGERARPMPSENGRFFLVLKVRIGRDGQVSDVLWSEIDASSDHDVGAQVLAMASQVLDALRTVTHRSAHPWSSCTKTAGNASPSPTRRLAVI